MLRFLAALILSFVGFAHAADATVPAGSTVVKASAKYLEGQQYKLLPPTASQGPTAKALLDSHQGKVEVIEFFNYGCPMCNRLEPEYEKWANSKKSTQMVEFIDVPVDWNHAGWENLARAFYIAEALGVLEKAQPALFNAIHVQHKNFKDPAELRSFFTAEASVPAAKFDETYDSFAVRRRLKQGELLREEYGIMAIPSFVINGKYYVDVQTAGGVQQTIDVVNYLVNKESFAKDSEQINFNDVPAKEVPTKLQEVTPSTK